MQEKSCLFYAVAASAPRLACTLSAGLTCEVWHPGVFRLKAKGLPAFPFFIWWLFHVLHVFTNRKYSVLLIRRNGKLVHRTMITPRYFRFPFMAADDIQVGDTWTDPEERGRGLATLAHQIIISTPSFRGRTCWGVIEPSNLAAIRAIEKAGYSLTGRGFRTCRFGLGILGRFVLTEYLDHEAAQETQQKESGRR